MSEQRFRPGNSPWSSIREVCLGKLSATVKEAPSERVRGWGWGLEALRIWSRC